MTSETPTTDAFLADRHYDHRSATYEEDYYAAINLARGLERALREFIRIDEEGAHGLMAADGSDVVLAIDAAKKALAPSGTPDIGRQP